jgi:hypothetical protein
VLIYTWHRNPPYLASLNNKPQKPREKKRKEKIPTEKFGGARISSKAAKQFGTPPSFEGLMLRVLTSALFPGRVDINELLLTAPTHRGVDSVLGKVRYRSATKSVS